jgi:rSAM/selenodomain-associated transferase 1
MPAKVTRAIDGSVPACGIAIMAKASISGRCKTRLVPPLTFEEAARCNTAFLRDVADNILAAARQASIAGYVAFGPPPARPFFEENLPADIGLIDAWHGDLGDCLSTTLTYLLARGHRSAVVLNGDSPTLPTSLLVETAQILESGSDGAVFGPADDGGYYLLGLNALHPELFREIAWSTEHVARQTLDRAATLGLPVYMLPQWYDVDDADTLQTLVAELFEGATYRRDLCSGQPRHTRALLQALFENSGLRERLTQVRERAAE